MLRIYLEFIYILRTFTWDNSSLITLTFKNIVVQSYTHTHTPQTLIRLGFASFACFIHE